MAIYDLFSKRQKRLRGEVPDVYTYDSIPGALRTQLLYVWMDTLGNPEEDGQKIYNSYKAIVEILCREYGVLSLKDVDGYSRRDHFAEFGAFFFSTNTEKALDVIELTTRYMNFVARKWEYMKRNDADTIVDEALHEINYRFRQHGIGYQFEDDKIIRIDTEFVHDEVVRPALSLLRTKHYKGVQQEFLKAHEHYRHGNYKEALNECLKAFESLMKAICDKRKWSYDGRTTASGLIQICLDNNLIPSFWQSHYTSLRSLLESSIPTGRNQLGGHGQGAVPTAVPDFLAAYMLHMTASALVFLAEAEKHLPN